MLLLNLLAFFSKNLDRPAWRKSKRANPGLIAFLVLLPLTGSGSESPPPVFNQAVSTALALAREAQALPSDKRRQVLQAAASIVFLVRDQRLLPPLDPARVDQLGTLLLADPPDRRGMARFAEALPPADGLVFDGQRLEGGNFRHIDSLMGYHGHPIAMDREPPVRIVPLEPAAAHALASPVEPPSNELRDFFTRVFQSPVGDRMVADGLFLRPYAGRLDDLFHHLVQRGDRTNQLEFAALLDSLPPRQYSPLTGTGRRADVPPPRYNLSNTLTGGGYAAVQNFRSSNPQASARNPFRGLAVRLLPSLAAPLESTPPGDALPLTSTELRKALGDPRRFTPGRVPPLFKDPSRFLGQWPDPRFLRVAKKKKTSTTLFEEIQKIDFETPLPEMDFSPAANEVLAADPEPESSALMEDLGLPKSEAPSYERAEAPPPVVPPEDWEPESIALPEPPPPVPVLEKPAPPPLDVAELPTGPSLDPPPSAPVEFPTPTPRPLQRGPSAVALVPAPRPPAASTPAPDATPLPVAEAVPVHEAPPSANADGFQVAVLTPTAVEMSDYLRAIAASDAALADNLATTRRAESIIRWLGDCVKPFEPVLASAPDDRLENLIRSARDEIVTLLALRESLRESRLANLKTRQAARDKVERALETTRRDTLRSLSGQGA